MSLERRQETSLIAMELETHRFNVRTRPSLRVSPRALGSYSAPAWARHPNCTGFIFGKDLIKGGCVPHGAEALNDFEDFVNMLGDRWGKSNSKARLSHL